MAWRRAGSTGAGHTLDHEEYRDLIAATLEAAKGRAPSHCRHHHRLHPRRDRRGKPVRDLDVTALQVTPVHWRFGKAMWGRLLESEPSFDQPGGGFHSPAACVGEGLDGYPDPSPWGGGNGGVSMASVGPVGKIDRRSRAPEMQSRFRPVGDSAWLRSVFLPSVAAEQFPKSRDCRSIVQAGHDSTSARTG